MLTIRELIEELNKIPNQNAVILEDIEDSVNVYTYIKAMESIAQQRIKAVMNRGKGNE